VTIGGLSRSGDQSCALRHALLRAARVRAALVCSAEIARSDALEKGMLGSGK
jgi:hypothetical protein